MRPYLCYYIYRDGQEIPVKICANNLNEAFLKASIDFEEAEKIGEIFFWNDDENYWDYWRGESL